MWLAFVHVMWDVFPTSHCFDYQRSRSWSGKSSIRPPLWAQLVRKAVVKFWGDSANKLRLCWTCWYDFNLKTAGGASGTAYEEQEEGNVLQKPLPWKKKGKRLFCRTKHVLFSHKETKKLPLFEKATYCTPSHLCFGVADKRGRYSWFTGERRWAKLWHFKYNTNN